ncbi:MAG: hypothetical protein RIR70_1425, partial [Pseudomonadota bacterium]
MKILRLLAFVLGGLVAVAALLLLAAWLVLASFDAAALKAELAQAVRDNNQRELKIEGELALTLWPGIGLEIGRASLSERESSQIFASVEEARATLALWPLFKKELVIDGLHAKGLSATVSRNAAGVLNIADLLGGKDSQAFKFALSRMALEEASLTWKDDKTGRRVVLQDAKLATGEISRSARGELSLQGRLQGASLDAVISAKSAYRFAEQPSSITLENTALALSGTLPTMQAAQAKFSLDRFRYSTAQAEGGAEGLQIVIKGDLPQDTIEARLSVPRIVLAGDEARSDAIQLALKAKSAQPNRHLEAKLVAEGMRADATALSLTRAGLDATAQLGGVSLRTRLSSPATMAFSPAQLALSGLSGQLDITDAKKLGKPMRVGINSNLGVDLTHARAQGQLNLRLDETTARIDWTMPRFSPLVLNADLEADQINIDKYLLPKGATQAATPAEAAQGGMWASLAALEGVELVTHAHIGSLQVARIKAHDVKFDLKHAAGVLTVSPFQAGLYQGQASGSLRAVAASSEVNLKQQISQINLAPLLRDLLGEEPIEGRGSAVLDLTARGAHSADWARSLFGSARLELKDGAIKGVNLPRLLRDLKAAAKSAPTPAARSEKTDFTEISASFQIQRGIARNEDLAFKSPLLRGSGSGSIDLPAGTLDYLARVSVVGTSTGQGGEERNDLRGVTLPLRIQGPLAAPKVQLDVGEMA